MIGEHKLIGFLMKVNMAVRAVKRAEVEHPHGMFKWASFWCLVWNIFDKYLFFINVFTNRGKVQKTFVYSMNNFLSYWYSGNSFSSALSSVHRLTFVIISIFQFNFYFFLPFRFICWTTTQCRLWLMWWECWRRLLLTLLLSALRSFVQMISE